MNLRKFSLFSAPLILLLLVGTVSAWTGPTDSPPDGNVAAPVNVGTTDQVKNGGLSVNAFTAWANAYFAGNVGIGTASPAQKLVVSGNSWTTGNLIVQDGRVGIGVTNPTAGRLEINGTSDLSSAGTGIYVYTYATSNAGPWSIRLGNSNQGSFYWGLGHTYEGAFRIGRDGDSITNTFPVYITKAGAVAFGSYGGNTNYRVSIAGGSFGGLYFQNSSATPQPPTGGASLFAAGSDLRGQDGSGNVTVLTPHRFDLIPGGASEKMAWSFYSERQEPEGTYTINADMTKALRILENISGEKIVHVARDGIDDGSKPASSMIDDLYEKIEVLTAKASAQEAEIESLRAKIDVLEKR